MASFNRVILLGNVTRDIELKYLDSGTAVTDIGLAVNNRRKDSAGNVIEETVFIDITIWARLAEIASEYLRKGSPVLIEGRLKLDQWEKDGQKRSKIRVVAESMQLLGKRENSHAEEPTSQQSEPQSATARPKPPTTDLDDVPF